jgi:chromosome partitioning protein
MSEPDDAAWIAAAGAPRPDDGPADDRESVATGVDGTEHSTGDTVLTVLPGLPVGYDAVPAGEPDQAAAPPAPEPAAAEPTVGLWADPAPAATAKSADANAGVAGSSSPALRAMRGRDPEPAPVISHGPAIVLAMCNQKGGVGKTTSTINLGAALAEYGRRVLLVDLDPQGALSAGLGIAAHELERTIYDLMLSPNTPMTDVLMPTGIEGVDLIPANIDLAAGEVQLINEVGREHTLARALRHVLHAYDYVLIDCQPSLGLLTVNALACAHGVIIPLAAEYFSLRGVALLVDTISKVQDRINPDLSLEGVLITMYDGRTVHAREVVGMLHQRFGDTVFDTVIGRTVKFPETTVAGEPITSYAPISPAAQAYRALAREVIAR